MVVKTKFIVDDAMIDVVGFEEVLKRSSSFVWILFNVVHFRLRDLDRSGSGRQKGRQGRELELEHPVAVFGMRVDEVGWEMA